MIDHEWWWTKRDDHFVEDESMLFVLKNYVE
jgi:hypothetical protein